MASVKFGKGSDEWLMFMDFWNLCQKYWIAEDTDSFYEQSIREINQFYEKYKGIRLAEGLATAFMKTIIEGESSKYGK